MSDVTLHLGNCFTYMQGMADGSVDAVITDAPYEDEAHTPMRRTRATIEKRQEIAGMPFDAMDEDTRKKLVAECKRLSKGWALVFSQAEAVGKYAELFGSAWRRPMVWVKPDAAPQFTGDRPAMGYESICAAWCNGSKSSWNGGGTRGVFVYNSTGYEHKHPAQKPIPLMIRLIELFTNPGDTVFDPYMGSGMTGVACVLTGRNFIGCELKKNYFDMAKIYIENAQKQIPMFPYSAKIEAEQLTFDTATPA